MLLRRTSELAQEFGVQVNQMGLRRTSQPVEKAAYGSSTEGIQPLPAAGREVDWLKNLPDGQAGKTGLLD